MFDKRKDEKQDASNPQNTERSYDAPAAPAASASKGKTAVIGPGIRINGDISGEENLVIEGRVDGSIKLKDHQVDVGPSGRVTANVTANVVRISGEVNGDITGQEKVVISRSGNVHGNIVAPRVTLEDGAIFKGSIDMDPGEAAKAERSVSAATPAPKPNGNGAGLSSPKPESADAGLAQKSG
ncbi:MAG: polymer-forming cytoskeletal protein [Xanthomonadales bacterium]|nr:polymer-forming cytoskeletal protein [Xanthomonadales bacterium]